MFLILSFTIIISAFLLHVFRLNPLSWQDVRRQIRKIVAIYYLWHWKRRNGLMFKFKEDGKDMACYGLTSVPEAIMRENPRALTRDLNAIDSIGFQGTSNDGQALIVRIVRHHDRCSEVVVYMRLASGEEYQLPAHPDSLVYNTDGKTFSADGLILEVQEPLRRWRILFNGTLARMNGPSKEDVFVSVQFHFIWKPMSDYVGFPHDYKAKILADQMANQHSNNTNLLQSLSKLVNDNERYEQFGVCCGRVTVGDNIGQTMLLRGIKERTNGIFSINSLKSKISINGVTNHGLSFHLFAINTKSGRSLVYGYFCAPCNSVIRHVHQWSADLNQLNAADEFTLSLKAGDRDYKLEMKSTEQNGVNVLCGKEGNFREDIRVFKLKLNGKEGHGFVLTGNPTNGYSSFANRKSLPQLIEPEIKSADRTVVTFQEVECRSSNIVGGKGSSLALMTSLAQNVWQLPIQFEVPHGVCITNLAFERHLRDHPELETEISTLENIAWKRTKGSTEMQCERLVQFMQTTVVSHALRVQLKSSLVAVFGHEFEKQKFAVRSSAIGEDGVEISSAGQNETFLGIKGLEEISLAIVKCWASQFTTRAIEYKRQNGQLLNGGMAVVVQNMVPADVAGVLFTSHPVTGSRAHMLISSNYGLGESVVSGSADPDTILLRRNWNKKPSVLEKHVGEKKLKITMSDMNGTIESEVSHDLASKISVTDEMAIKLGQIATYLEQSWGSARDIEWAIKEDKIYLLQSRPVTTDSILTDFEVQHEFDTVLRTNQEVFSTANVGEVFPGCTTPLSYSTIFRSFSLIMMNMTLWKTRLHRYDPTVLEFLSMAYNRFFLNRTLEKFLSLDTKKSGLSKSFEVSIYGEVLDDDDVLDKARERADGPPFMASSKVLLCVLKSLLFGKWIARQAKKKFGHYPAMARNTSTIQDAYQDIIDHYFDLNEAASRLMQTTVASGLWTFIVFSCLDGGNEYKMETYMDFAKLTSGAIGTESADVPNSLKELAALIAEDIEPSEFRRKSTEDALKWISEGKLPSSRKYKQFMERHGHRGYKENDMISKTWSAEPERLVRSLQEMLRNPESLRSAPSSVPEPDVIDTLLTPLSPIRKKILRWANFGARGGVRNREQFKTILIKVIDGARKGYRHLARLMVAEGILPEEDLLFYLTHEEIGTVIETRSAILIRRAKQRQRMCAIMDSFKFPGIMCGIPEPSNLNENEVELNGLTQVKGFPVSLGVVQGVARVIHSFDEVHTIKKGDILITHSTDIGWSPYFPMLAGIVTELGGLVSHGAVVAREFGLPCFVGALNATRIFKSDEIVLLNASKGILAKVKPDK